jgi:hypothetical protein
MLNYGTKFAGLGTGVFPTFAAKNASGPTATDGFPYTADSVNDWIGFTQALLNKAGLTPSGQLEVNGASQLIEAMMRGAAQRPGDIVQTAIPAEKRAVNRLLDLSGQIISITGPYADLAANVYVGDALNGSAAAFYKCDAAGNRTPSGAYMKLPDCRGLFLRGTGQSGMYTTAGGVLYNGGAIGVFLYDKTGTPDLSFSMTIAASDNSELLNSSSSSDTPEYIAYGKNANIGGNLKGQHKPLYTTSEENRPASISLHICITY